MNEFNYDDSAYLAHHGIKGMKWGVRKDRNSYKTGKSPDVYKRKAMLKKLGKAALITAGAVTATGAIAGGLTLANTPKARYARYERQAKRNYKKQQKTIDWIKNNPDSLHQTPSSPSYKKRQERQAKALYKSQQSTIDWIKNNPDSLHQTPSSPSYKKRVERQAKANYKAQQPIINSINNQRYTPTPKANYRRQQSTIDWIKNNPDSHTQTHESESYKRYMARKAKGY